jgi:hypothetical protein
MEGDQLRPQSNNLGEMFVTERLSVCASLLLNLFCYILYVCGNSLPRIQGCFSHSIVVSDDFQLLYSYVKQH